MNNVEPTYFAQIGYETGLRNIIDDFIERVTADPMIGFFFRKVDKTRLKQLEYEHAAEHLGSRLRYTGRPLDQAHAHHRIQAGQFARRLQILRETLADHRVPQPIVQAWIDHQIELRPLITAQTS